MELTGDDVPLLFNKWKPQKFEDYNIDDLGERLYEEDISQNYFFEDLLVIIVSHLSGGSTHKISAKQRLNEKDAMSLEKIFDPTVLEIWEDGKQNIEDKIKLNNTIPELKRVNVHDSKYSNFRRRINFSYSINQKGNEQKASEIYQGLEQHLCEEFGFDKSRQGPGGIETRGTQFKRVDFLNGIFISAQASKDYENAGKVYFSISCDENGKKEDFEKVLNSATQYIETHASNLKQYSTGSLNFPLQDQGSHWEIDLSSVKVNPKLEGQKKLLLE